MGKAVVGRQWWVRLGSSEEIEGDVEADKS